MDLCPRGAGKAARRHARFVAAGSAGDLLRRQRNGDDAATDDGLRRPVPQTRPGQRSAGRARGVGGRVVRPAWALPLERATLRLRLVDAGDGRPAGVLRLGVRRAVRLHRARPRTRDRDDVGGHARRRTPRPPARDLRSGRAPRRRPCCIGCSRSSAARSPGRQAYLRAAARQADASAFRAAFAGAFSGYSVTRT